MLHGSDHSRDIRTLMHVPLRCLDDYVSLCFIALLSFTAVKCTRSNANIAAPASGRLLLRLHHQLLLYGM